MVLGRFARSLDGRAYERVSALRSQVLDEVLPRLSSVADHSVLWVAVACALAAIGGRRGRRAAVRGLATVAVTSAVVNVPLKLLWRRPRPEVSDVVEALVRRPRSFSFPSGHSASAFAFAAAAGAELPGLLPPLLVVAGAVGWSRVHGRVHYPGDVLAGAAIGTAVALTGAPIAVRVGRRSPGARG